MQINTQKKKTGIIAPRRFVQRLKRDNELFRSYMHQVCYWLYRPALPAYLQALYPCLPGINAECSGLAVTTIALTCAPPQLLVKTREGASAGRAGVP